LQALRLPSIEDGVSCPDDIVWLIHAVAVLSLGPVSRLAESHDHVKGCYIGGFTGFAGSRSVMKVCWLQDSYVDVRKRLCPRIHMLTFWIGYAELVPDTEHPLNKITVLFVHDTSEMSSFRACGLRREEPVLPYLWGAFGDQSLFRTDFRKPPTCKQSALGI